MLEPLNLTGTPRLIAALAIGILIGFTLVKANLAGRRPVLDALRLRNGNAINTVLTTLLTGMAIFFFARLHGAVSVHTHTGYLWASLIGGVCCGLGLLLAGLTPVTALAALGGGGLHSLWAIGGMALAVPAAKYVSDALSRTLYRWDATLPAAPEPAVFFDAGNPALYLGGVLIALIVLVRFTLGNKAK